MPFDLQPTLTGKLLELRPLLPSEFESLYAVAADPLIWEVHPNSDRYQRPVFEKFFADALASGGALVVRDLATKEIIGSSRYNGYDPEKCEIEIGWTFLARKYWGGIYNGELKQLMLDHAFHFVNRVLFIVGEHNYRSQKALLKIGARLIGTKDDGSGIGKVVFAIDNPNLVA